MSNLRWVENRHLKILDFDIENRPLSYMGSDWTSGEVTVIAAAWMDGGSPDCRWLLPDDDESMAKMLMWFAKLYNEADVVAGHYIRKHDLPVLAGAMLEADLPALGSKLSIDTKLDLVKTKHLSMSQESLGEMLGVPGKYHMTQPKWRQANRLTPEGVKESVKRCVADVNQHRKMYRRLTERGLLGPPRVWRSV